MKNKPWVTIGIPIYKRLYYLDNVLSVVESQDYPAIELLVSDNGMNGRKVREIVDARYRGPYRFRQNPKTVSLSTHFNQLIRDASGKYFLVLADDDEISPNYVSELVAQLERYPQARLALSVQETIDERGAVVRRSSAAMPEILSGTRFIGAAWGTHEYAYESFSTFLAKKEDLLACGGYPDFWKGHANDDALVVKLCLGHYAALNNRCSFRKRFDEESHGFALPIADLSRGIRDFLNFLNADPAVMEYARSDPAGWEHSKKVLVGMAWKTYYYRWSGLYRNRLTFAQWLRAGFAMPLIPDYYRAVASTFMGAGFAVVESRAPGACEIYRSLKRRCRRAAS